LIAQLAHRAVPAVVAFGVVLALGLAGGGFFPRSWRLATLALLCAAAGALLARERVVLTRRDWASLAALTALAAWAYASGEWSSLPDGSRLEAERGLLYAAALLAVLVGVTRETLGVTLVGVLGGVTAVAAYAVGRHLLDPPPLDPFQGTNLHEPFGYSNAIGIFVAVGIVLAVGLAAAASTRRLRAAALAPLVVLVPTLVLTSSRGAWMALPFGLAAVLAVSRAVRPRTLVVLLALGVVAAFAIGSEPGQPLTLFGENRPHYWRVAWRDVEEHPLLGSGAGTFGAYWLEHRTIGEFVHDAHSLFLETLAELGPVGLALVLAALGAPLLGLGRRRHRVVAAAAGAYVAFLLHAAIDWDWEFGAVGVVGVVCGGATLVGTREEGSPLTQGGRRLLLAAVLGAAFLVAVRLIR
jgi:hypothetical protein